MNRRRNRHRNQEPSLVPLADMLTNTVGIMLFILAFTVLATGGVSIPKRLPMEQDTDSKPVYFLCIDDRILPVDFDDTDRLPKPFGTMDLAAATDFVKKGDNAEVENAFFRIRQSAKIQYANGIPSRLYATAEFFPKPGVGLALSIPDGTNRFFGITLDQYKIQERFIYFMVRPDAISTFYHARDIASKKGFRCGWGPLGPTNNVVVNLIGGGGGNVPKPE